MVGPGPEQAAQEGQDYQRRVGNVHGRKSRRRSEYRQEVVGGKDFSETSEKKCQSDVLLQECPQRILNESKPEGMVPVKSKVRRMEQAPYDSQC